MSEIKKPSYIHYTRIPNIRANEAQWLLASIELRDRDIYDPDEYNKLLEEKMVQAGSVLVTGLDDDEIKYTADDQPYDFIDSGEKTYYFKNIILNITDFCTWASKKKYKLPEELAELSTWPTGKKTVAPATGNAKTVDGLLKIVIAMAMDCYGFDPADEKSTVTADISKALDKCGLSVSENTIRTRLKQAELLLPRDQK